MNPFEIIYILICGIGTFNSLLLVIYYVTRKTDSKVLNVTLALIILTFSLRVSKALWLNFFLESHPILHILWYPAFILMGFLMVYYSGKFSIIPEKSIYLQLSLLLSALIVLFVVYTYIFNAQMEVVYFLVLSTGISLFNFYKIKSSIKSSDKFKLSWIKYLSIYILIINCAYLAVLFISFNLLLVESFIFSIFIYALIFVELKFHLIKKIHTHINSITDEDRRILRVVEDCMTEEKIFLDSNLILSSLAKKIGVSSHLLSKTINNSTGMNFNDYVNSFRIEEVKKILSKKEDSRKIASIAYDCGFNSLSVFNSAFKKFTGSTPSAFIKNI